MIKLGEVTVPVRFEMTDEARELLRLEVKKIMLELLNENYTQVTDLVRGIVRDEMTIDRKELGIAMGMHKGVRRG